jgi:hypothetical protein
MFFVDLSSSRSPSWSISDVLPFHQNRIPEGRHPFEDGHKLKNLPIEVKHASKRPSPKRVAFISTGLQPVDFMLSLSAYPIKNNM